MLDETTEGLDYSSLTGFAVNPLNRLSERRHEPKVIEGLRAQPNTKTLVLAGEIPVLRRVGNGYEAEFTFVEALNIGQAREIAFLGLNGEDPVFATLIEQEIPENRQTADDLTRIDLRSIAAQGLLSPALLGALSQAKSLMYWHKRHRYCSNCGNMTSVSCAGWKRDCPYCQAAHFPRTDPVVIMLVRHGDTCLLGRQPSFIKGMYSCLAGFMEAGETIEDAVRRETREEAGIRVGKVSYLASQPWPFPASLMIGCIGDALEDEIKLDQQELEDARWFSRDEVRQMLDKTHPLGLSCPPKLAIANLLIRFWATNEIGGQ
jgi:NAD+ diphosphatase